MIVHHLPVRNLDRAVERLAGHCLGGELYGETEELLAAGISSLERAGAVLRDAGLSVTLHAPFRGIDFGTRSQTLSVGCNDSSKASLDAAFASGARVIVFHTGFHPQRSSCDNAESWKSTAIGRFTKLANSCKDSGTLIALENVYDTDPGMLHELLDELPENVGLCIDTGHINIFSQCPLESWFSSNRVFEVHLHDNDGSRDAHLEVGAGNFPFPYLAELLRNIDRKPILAFEPGTREASEKGIEPLLSFARTAGYDLPVRLEAGGFPAQNNG